MPRIKIVTLIGILCVLLAGCVATPEERIEQGLAEAQRIFEQDSVETNETAENTELYLPKGYTVEEPSDEHNIIITRGSDSYVLFINPNESADSTFFYDLQKANSEQEWLVDETFEQSGRFGFVTVREVAEDREEVVVSSGGVKMTTISETGDIDENMEWMMKTVRSIDTEG